MTEEEAFEINCLAQIRDNNLAWVQEFLTQARAQMLRGKGHLSFMATGSENGKSYTRNLQVSANMVSVIASRAIDQAAGITPAGDVGRPIFTHFDHGNQFVNS